MGSLGRRARRQAMREQLKADRQSGLDDHPRWGDSGSDNARAALTAVVAAGKAKIALTTTDDMQQLICVLWQPGSPQIVICGVDDQPGMQAMASAAYQRGMSEDEWFTFINDHMQASISAAGRETSVSLIEWKPGEGPLSASASGHAPG